MSVPFFNQAVDAHPSIPDEIAQGQFSTLLGWLQENIYQHGRKYMPAELYKRVTGETMSAQPYLAYLREKYGTLYEL
jgi:carboxypeptidase Taq